LNAARFTLNDNPSIEVQRSASLYQSEPVGVDDQPWFLNTVLEVRTTHSPWGLLRCCKQVEQHLGRQQRERWGPREIDVDILLYENWVVSGSILDIPHSRMTERDFVLIPLLDLLPDGVDPITRKPFRAFVHAFNEKKVEPFNKKF
jgi:2-amino-4-hydroxy-6-hydroxymethyldihydropteridine diphosphokinase